MEKSDVIAYVLDGLADYLELERELGVRTLEIGRREIGELANNRIVESKGGPDRTPLRQLQKLSQPAQSGGIGDAALPLYSGRGASHPSIDIAAQCSLRSGDMMRPQGVLQLPPLTKAGAGSATLTRGTGEARGTSHSTIRPFVFIADGPLSPKAAEIMAKIVPALGQTPETAPVVVAPPIPDARFFVFLGQSALAKYVPGLHGEANRWLKSPKGRDVLLVTSPEEIVRFKTVTPACKKMKQEMWLALKTLRQRAELGM